MFLQKLKLVPVLAGVVASAALAAGLLAAPPPPPPAAPAVPGLRVAADPPKAAPAGPNRIVLWRKGELVALDPDGGNQKVVLGGPAAPGIQPHMFAVSPDGTRAAVVRIKNAIPPGPIPAQLPPVRLFVHDLGKAAQPADVAEVADAGTVAWSADGKVLAVCTFTDGRSPADIKATHYVYTVATKARTPVKLPDNHILTDWTRDGRHFLTMEIGTDKDTPVVGLWVMNRDGTENKRLAGPPGFVSFGRFSPDGKRVLARTLRVPEATPKEKAERDRVGLGRPQPRAELILVETATAKATPVKDVPLNADVQGYCWSPDGKRIAYVWREQHPPGTDPMTETASHLTVCDPDGANQKTILSATGRNTGEMTLAGVDWR